MMAMLFMVVFLGMVLLLYGASCYVLFRIARKFDPQVGYVGFLVPVYQYYLLLQYIMPQAGQYLLIMVGVSFLGSIAGEAMHSPALHGLAQLVVMLMACRALGLLAERLGKSYWLFAVLGLIPIANFVAMLILAFDDSRPIGWEADKPWRETPLSYREPGEEDKPPAPPGPPVPPTSPPPAPKDPSN